MKTRLRFTIGLFLTGLLVLVGWAHSQPGAAQAEVPTLPPPLSEDLVRFDDQLFTKFVRNRTAAIELGKALFWDMQVGSDIQACASCHFHAGADNRARNQLSPSGAPPAAFADPPRTDFFPPYMPDDTVVPADFPRPKANDDRTSSQGIAHIRFLGMVPKDGGPELMDDGEPAGDEVFRRDGLQLRRVEPRNTPTVINSILFLRNFWDGRANFIFNGVNPFGRRDTDARVADNDSGSLKLVRVDIEFASTASQAVGPPESDFEMSFAGRTLRDIGRKMLTLKPLGMQLVHPDDSVLGDLSAYPDEGLTSSYSAMIEKAFYSRWWNSSTLTDGFTQKEYNFSLFFGIAVMLYESLLVSDEAPIDRFLAGDDAALTDRQKLGADVFLNKGKCINCHNGPEFSGAASVLFKELEEGGLVERMLMADQDLGPALYDNGFYNIGVRQTQEDLGVGGEDPFNNPLSFSRQYVLMLRGQNVPDPFQVDPCTFEVRFQREDFPDGTTFREVTCGDGSTTVEPTGPDSVLKALRVAVDGAFKTPTLRNIELTGPYFHNGGQATLRQVVEFYDRGGDFPDENRKNLDPDIQNLGLTDAEEKGLVDFMLAMTDERVRYQRAPFDHPQLFIPNGHGDREDRGDGVAKDVLIEIPAVGASGKLLNGAAAPPLNTFLCLDPFASDTPSTSTNTCPQPGDPKLLFFWNGEGCTKDTCDASTGYKMHATREFSAGDDTAAFASTSAVTGDAALHGDYGMASMTAYEYMRFTVNNEDLLSSKSGTICSVVKNAGAPAVSGRRLYLALAKSAASYILVEFYGSDDLRIRYRDRNGVNTNPTTSPWNGADTKDTMLVQVSYDSTSSPGLRMVVDGVERISRSTPVVPLGDIYQWRIGNASSKDGSFYYDQFVTSSDPNLDCWDLLAGSCSGNGDRCIDDADCPSSQTCVGVREDYTGGGGGPGPDPGDDLCPDDPDKTEPGICGCGTPDTDTDTDGTPDCNDDCRFDPDKTEPGICGCGVSDTDTDHDGVADCNDDCPLDPDKTEPGICGCGVAEDACGDECVDADGDGYGTGADCLGPDCDDDDPSVNVFCPPPPAGDSGILFFMNGEGCGESECDSSTDYTLHPSQEFSAGGDLGTFNSETAINPGAALYGSFGLESLSSYDFMRWTVSGQDIMSSSAGTICTIVKNAGVPAESGRRLFLAQAKSATSYILAEFRGTDDLRINYRDKNSLNTRVDTGSWNGADTTDAMLVQVSYDSTAAPGLRMVVDGVERIASGSPVEPLGAIDLLKLGNASGKLGAFYYDPFLISDRSDLDCWDLLAGTCSNNGDRCIDDADCGAGSCDGVRKDYDQLP